MVSIPVHCVAATRPHCDAILHSVVTARRFDDCVLPSRRPGHLLRPSLPRQLLVVIVRTPVTALAAAITIASTDLVRHRPPIIL